MRVGLVLGAGGIVGQAYHAGVLACLEHDLGWDPRTAELIVGTSAGAVTGALLRLGVPAHDLAAWTVHAPLSGESEPCRAVFERERPEFPPLSLRYWTSGWRLPPRSTLKQLARRPWSIRPTVLATTMMPPGNVDLVGHADVLDDVGPEQWPDGLWLCVARRDDGRRVVLGRADAPAAPLSEAVAASCAIPGYFTPIEIDGVECFDGGVHSPTNTDVLEHVGLDLVVVVAPMSAAGGLRRTADTLLRYAAHRRLEQEVRRLRDRGVTVVRVEPGERVLDVMGVNMMAEDRSDAVVQAAFIDTGNYCAMPRIATRLSGLRARGGSTLSG